MPGTTMHSSEDFAALVDGFKDGYVWDLMDEYSYLHSVATPESSLIVRRMGGFIVDCSLTSPTTGVRRSVFYSPANENIRKRKLQASHVMMPVGPYDGPGGQHGPLRWLPYDAEGTMVSHIDYVRLNLRPTEREQGGLKVSQYFDLVNGDTLERTLDFANLWKDGNTIQTSLGFHDYLNLPKGSEPFNINGQRIDDLLEERGAEEAIMGGNARLWHGFGGLALVHMPDGSELKLKGETCTVSNHPGDNPLVSHQVNMLLWSRPDTEGDNPFICLEPVIGVDSFEPGHNQGLVIPPRSDGAFNYNMQFV